MMIIYPTPVGYVKFKKMNLIIDVNMKKEYLTQLKKLWCMSCQKCVDRVKRIIGKHKGTADICVSLEDKEAVFTCEKENNIQAIVNAINDFGFNAAEQN